MRQRTDGGGGPRRSEGPRRLGGLATAGVTVVVLLGLSVVSSVAASGAQTRDGAGSISSVAPAIPGSDPRVQAWLKSREARTIELDNALQQVQHVTGPSRDATADCQRLVRAVASLRQGPPAPDAGLGGASAAGLDEFARAAHACQAGDYRGCQEQLALGASRRAEGQATVDEFLDGDAHAH